MANDELPEYLVGSKGVNLVASPLHTPPGALIASQNVEFISDQGMGGIGSRGGLAPLNSAALGGAVQALTNIPLSYPGEIDMMVGLNAGETATWQKTPDGAAYSNLLSAALGRPAGIDKTPSTLGGAAIFLGQRPASYKNQFYYPGDDYTLYPTIGATAPNVVVWNGSLSFEQFRVPTNPTATAGSVPYWISDMIVANGIVYLSVYDAGGVAPDHKGRVLAYDPTNGTLSQVGNRFGNGSGENTAGFPFCLTSYLGSLWAGTYGISGNNQGKVYRLRPGVDETWTLDLTATLHNGYFMGLCGYNGKLYAATDADASGTAIVQQRTSTGTWSTSLTAPAGNQGYFSGLIVFNGELYCCWYQSTVSALIKKFDGTTWTTDLNVGVTYAIKTPGTPFVFRGNLYWPFMGSDTSQTNVAGFLLKRTTGAAWSQPISAKGMRGCLGLYVP